MLYIMDIGGGEETVPCLTILIILLALIVAYIVLYLIQRFSGNRKVVRVCDYCGHAVSAVSECHHAPVYEKGGKYFCSVCRKRTEIICPRCKRPLH